MPAVFEKLTFKGDAEEIQCPECGKTEIVRVLSATSFMSDSGFGACVPGTNIGLFMSRVRKSAAGRRARNTSIFK